jgi:ribulose-5-phosphate 4-epimerase/fuculose-1-phosphate aldolase
MRRRTFVAGLALPFAAWWAGVRDAHAGQAAGAGESPHPTLLDDLVSANRILAYHGIVDGFGHVSVRHDRNPGRYLLSRSLAPDLVTAGDVMEFDLDSVAIDGKGRAGYSERFIHGEVYRARPDVNAVVHCHAAALIPFGVSTVALRPVSHMAAFLPERVPVFDIREGSGVTDMLVSDGVKARNLARALGSAPAVLMRGHGAVVVGSSLPIVVGRSIYLEMNARTQAQAMALGGPVAYLDPGEASSILAAGENGGYQRAWDLWKRQVVSK